MSEGNGCTLVKARFAFQQTNEDELSFAKGDIISVSRQEEGGWWEGSLNGKSGWFPSNYVRELKGGGGYLFHSRSAFFGGGYPSSAPSKMLATVALSKAAEEGSSHVCTKAGSAEGTSCPKALAAENFKLRQR